MKKITALFTIFAIFAALMIPAVNAADESNLQNLSEDSSSQEHPEKCYLSFYEPEFGEVDVERGYIGYEYSDGRSTYAFTYGETAVLNVVPDNDAYFNFAELNGIEVSPVNNVLRIVMTEDYEFNISFAPTEYRFIKIVCNYAAGLPEAKFTYEGAEAAEIVKVLPEIAVTLGFSAKDGGDIYLTEAYFQPDGGDKTDVAVDNATNTVTTLPISCDGTLFLNFGVAPVCKVTVIQTVGGTVSASNLEPYKGETVTFTLTASQSYTIKCIVVDGVEKTVTGNTYAVAVTADTTVSAVFTPNIVEVKVSLAVMPGADSAIHGTAAFIGRTGTDLTVTQGEVISVLFTPDTGYEINEVRVNGVLTSPDENGTITVTANENLTVTVSFKKQKFRITAVVTAQGGGNIAAEGYEINKNVVYVEYGDSITFLFTPDMHYAVYSVKADSVTVFSAKDGGTLEGNRFTFANVISNHTIAVTFASEGSVITEYTITASAGEHGTITPSGIQTVVQGESVTYTVAADEGYQIDGVAVDGIDVPLTNGAYTFTAVSADHTITASFKAKSAENNGIIGVNDINWTTAAITVNLTDTMIIDKAVIEKISADCQGRTITFKAADFEISFVAASSFGTAYLQLDLTASRGEAAPNYGAISGIIDSLPQYVSSVYAVVRLNDIFPANSSARIYVSEDFAGKTLSYFTYDSGELVRAAENVVCDQAGFAAVTLKNSKELVFIADAGSASARTVVVIAGENGVVTPTGTFTVNEGETFTFTAVPNDGYKISKIIVNDEIMKIDGTETEYSVTVGADTEIEVRFALKKDENSSKAGLIISIVIIVIALAGGGVLFAIKWKQTRY